MRHQNPDPDNKMTGKDVESFQSQAEKHQKRINSAVYIVAFIVFQCIAITVFSVVVMKVRTPKFRVGDNLQIQTLSTNTLSSPSFDLTFIAPIKIKNANFGPYKYDATTVDFTYEEVQVGQVVVPKSKVNFKSTKKVDVTVSLNSSVLSSNSNLGSDLSSGLLTLSSRGKMNGIVELILIFEKKKSIDMNCVLAINVPEKTVKSVECK